MARRGADRAMRGDGARRFEDSLRREPGNSHHHVEKRHDTKGEPPPVEPAVDQDERHRDEVGEDEGNDAAKGDPTRPERRGQGHVAYRADPADDRDEGSHQRVFSAGPEAVTVETTLPPSARRVIMIGPPTNSATANCQPSRTSITMPSSTTRLVDATMKIIALVKSAPLAKRDLLIADAAYEQLEDIMPYPEARTTALGRCVPSLARIWSLETKAWTIPDSVKPSTSAQSVSQNI